ncbi:MAG: GNAT family N-acetyltransferase [Burkholderiales bacterium]|nr:GNAT family N-acetyltransferase [Burkholderiales bacterium]
MQIIEVTDARGTVIAPQWLERAEPVHRQLRPQLPEDYAGAMQAVFADGGRMCVAATTQSVAGVAVYRFVRNTHVGKKLYVDDLVTDAAQRSRGVGHALLTFLETRAREQGASSLELDSGTQRQQAHRFYFREGLVIASFSFKKALT